MKRTTFVTLITFLYILVCTVQPVFAVNTFSSSMHSHYVPMECSSMRSEIITNEVVDGISFKILKINNGDNEESNYKYIKVKLVGSDDTQWIVGGGDKPTVISGKGSSTMIIRIEKLKTYEVLTASTLNNTIKVYYYGNNSFLDAYVYIQEGINETID